MLVTHHALTPSGRAPNRHDRVAFPISRRHGPVAAVDDAIFRDRPPCAWADAGFTARCPAAHVCPDPRCLQRQNPAGQ